MLLVNNVWPYIETTAVNELKDRVLTEARHLGCSPNNSVTRKGTVEQLLM